MIILGVVLLFFGGCNILGAMSVRNDAAMVGSMMIALVFFIPGVLALVFGIKRTGTSPASTAKTLGRKCPACAEIIQLEAKICRYCGRDLPESPAPSKTICGVCSRPSDAHQAWCSLGKAGT